MISFSSAWHIYRFFRPAARPGSGRTRPGWLATSMFPIGLEVGFSSSGSGALGTLALLGLTYLDTEQVVGTDLAFGLCLALIGGGLAPRCGRPDGGLLVRLIAGGVLGAIAGNTLAPRIPARPSAWLFPCGYSPLASSYAGRPLHWPTVRQGCSEAVEAQAFENQTLAP